MLSIVIIFVVVDLVLVVVVFIVVGVILGVVVFVGKEIERERESSREIKKGTSFLCKRAVGTGKLCKQEMRPLYYYSKEGITISTYGRLFL